MDQMKHDDPDELADHAQAASAGEAKSSARMMFFIIVGLYLITYLIHRTAYWFYELTVPGAGVRRDLRYVIFGRMLKFKPLPASGEAAHVSVLLSTNKTIIPILKL